MIIFMQVYRLLRSRITGATNWIDLDLCAWLHWQFPTNIQGLFVEYTKCWYFHIKYTLVLQHKSVIYVGSSVYSVRR